MSVNNWAGEPSPKSMAYRLRALRSEARNVTASGAAPEGGAALVAIQRLVENGSIKPHESVVLFNTGGALKYLDVIANG